MRGLIAALLMLAFAQDSIAATERVGAFVTRLLVADEGRWGGCMVLLDRELSDFNLNCPSRWVTFSCTGDFTSKDNAYRMFDAAQMAMALGTAVDLTVDDQLKHNGYCYANRIDVRR